MSISTVSWGGRSRRPCGLCRRPLSTPSCPVHHKHPSQYPTLFLHLPRKRAFSCDIWLTHQPLVDPINNRFIKQEADEKSSEIAVAAEEEFNITKLQLLEGEKAKVRRDFDRRQKANAVRKKVEYSKRLNENRIRVLQAREDAVQALLRDAQASLLSLSLNTAEYSRLMLSLIVEGMHKLGESPALIRCREIDVPLVESLMPQVEAAFRAAHGREAPNVLLDTANPLPPPPRNAEEQSSGERVFCSGGVIVTSSDGSIECTNTLDDRLRIAYMGNLPALRGMFDT